MIALAFINDDVIEVKGSLLNYPIDTIIFYHGQSFLRGWYVLRPTKGNPAQPYIADLPEQDVPAAYKLKVLLLT